MAQKVLYDPREKLYGNHLRPSYTNLQAADILVALNKPGEAEWFATGSFDFFYDSVSADLEKQKRPDDLDVYVLRQSADLLDKLGRNEFRAKVARLKL